VNDYQREQKDALIQVNENIGSINDVLGDAGAQSLASYILFRQNLDAFSALYFGDYCTQTCFESRTSACCSKDGIITFWADMVINVYHSDKHQIDDLFEAIQNPVFDHKCIYLGATGCRWQIRPLGCALFLCDGIQSGVLQRPDLASQWANYRETGRCYRWPDQPVLFDRLEQVFMDAGCRSTLMYLNTSPGLLRVKRKAALL